MVKIKVKCDFCGKKLKKLPCRLKSKNHFCNQKCYSKFRIIHKKVKTKCDYCGKQIVKKLIDISKFKYHFCNRLCQSKFGWIEVKCSFCNRKKLIHKCLYRYSRTKRFYCSRECQDKDYSFRYSGKNHSNWKGGISFEPYNYEFNQIKREIKERDKWICQLCGFIDTKKDGKLCVHHIDYDKKNNNISNLVSLCHICNGKVNYDREYWKKYFQNLMGERK